MIKEIYLIRGIRSEDYKSFSKRIFKAVKVLESEIKPSALKFTITDKAPPKLSVIPFRKDKIAVISVYKKEEIPVNSIRTIEGFCGAFTVEEALPVSYHKYWKDGEPTPGVCLLTLFSKKKHIGYEQFITRWHSGHTPLSIRIHPLWNYVRNVVHESLSEKQVWFDGIVEEQVKRESDLLNPFKFFGNPLIILYRMLLVYFDTKSFIDYSGMETYLANEYHILSK
ncbi:MAG: hypothetical protein JXB24_08450 [Bacteroidales bacterium]|nr:hypothetical protein [Bacteroidales bacterium]